MTDQMRGGLIIEEHPLALSDPFEAVRFLKILDQIGLGFNCDEPFLHD
jgi:hypothetical protein